MVEEKNIVDTEIEEETKTSEDGKLSKDGIMKALKNAIAGGVLKSTNAKSIRQQMGIFNSSFTKKKISKSKRKAKRKAQKSARRMQRKSKHK